MMDRERKDELPQMQVEFIDQVCRPLYSTLSESFPWIKPLLDGCLANREKWMDLAEKVRIWVVTSALSKITEWHHIGRMALLTYWNPIPNNLRRKKRQEHIDLFLHKKGRAACISTP